MKSRFFKKVIFIVTSLSISVGGFFSTSAMVFSEEIATEVSAGFQEEAVEAITDTNRQRNVSEADDNNSVTGSTTEISGTEPKEFTQENQVIDTDPTVSEELQESDYPKAKETSGVSASLEYREVQVTLNGFVNSNGSWRYYKNGKLYTDEDIVQGIINNKEGWYYIKDGVADLSKTGIEHNVNGWWYIKNGKVDFSYTGVRNNVNGWWYIKNGKVDFNYNGFAQNENGWWYIENGKVTFSKNDVILGTVNKESAWWNVKGSKVLFNESIEQNTNGWWYITNGKVDFGYTGVRNNTNGWWYIKNGKVDFDYNGFAQNENGWWYIENGKVTFSKNDVILGTVNKESAWWNVKGSKVFFNESIEQNINGWWYIKNGKVDFGYNGLAENENGWWYIENGKVTFAYTGTAKNEYGNIWRVENSKVNFSYNIASFKNGTWAGFVNGRYDPSAAVVAQASKDENGNFFYGKAGDQTGEEVYCRTWNDHPWPYVIRAKSATVAEKIAYAMERAVLNDKIGYDMGQRNALYNLASKVGWDPGKVTTNCEADCSSLVTVALIYAGVNKNVVYQDNNSSVTSNLRKRLLTTGQFEVFRTDDYSKSPNKLKRGDILLEEGEHTAVVVKPVTE